MFQYKESESIKIWIERILQSLASVTIAEIQAGQFSLSFENSEKIIAAIYDHILETQVCSIKETTNDPNLVLVVGNDILGKDVTSKELFSSEHLDKTHIVIPEYPEAKVTIFDYALLLKNKHLKHMGKDEAFNLIYKFNFALKCYYNQIKFHVIQRLLKLRTRIASSIQYDAENTHELLSFAKTKGYQIIIIDFQINQQHIHKEVENYNFRFNTDFSAGIIYQEQNLQLQYFSKFDADYIIVSSEDNTDPVYKHVTYSLSAKLKPQTIEHDDHTAKPVNIDLTHKIIGLINNFNLKTFDRMNAFSSPYKSFQSILKLNKKIHPRAIPIFDDRHFETSLDIFDHLNTADSIRSYLCFLPERSFLHFLITYIYINLCDAHMITKELIAEVSTIKSGQVELIKQKIIAFYREVEEVIYPELCHNSSISEQMNKDQFINMYVFSNIQTYLKNDFDLLISEFIATDKYKLLSRFDIETAKATLLVGGCGCGKTTYNKYVFNKNSGHDQHKDSLFLNIDDLFEILYNDDIHINDIIFSEWSFEETLMLHDRIVDEIVKMSHTNKLPNLYYEGIYIIQRLINVYASSNLKVTSLSVPLETAIYRVYKREQGARNPLGTCFVVNTYRKNALLISELLQSNKNTNYSNCELVLKDTDFDISKQEKPVKICVFNFTKKTLYILNFPLFFKYFISIDVNNFAIDYSDIYSASTVNNAISLIRKFFTIFHTFFVDPGCGETYLEANHNNTSITDEFLFYINFNMLQLNILKRIIFESKVITTFPETTRILIAEQDQDTLFIDHHNHSMSSIILKTIHKLEKILFVSKSVVAVEDRKVISDLIENIQISFENHRVDDDTIIALLNDGIHKALSEDMKAFLKSIVVFFEKHFNNISHIKEQILASKSTQDKDQISSIDKKFQRIDTSLFRYYESSFSAKLLTNPPQHLMSVIGEISKNIIKSIEININTCSSHIFAYFLNRLHCSHAAYGRFDHVPTIQEVCLLLSENKQEHICQIMFTHFVFIDVCYRNFEIFDTKADDYSDEFGKLWNPTKKKFNTKEEIKELANVYLYGSDMFKDRFRISKKASQPLCDYDFFHESNAFSNHHGIMSHSGPPLFGVASHFWHQDQFFALTDPLKSNMSAQMFRTEIPYVSGVSGMATLFIPCALLIGKVESQEKFTYYLLAIAAYLAHGGLHSWHEVFAVAQHKLNLLATPDNKYHIRGKNIGNFNHVLNILAHDTEIQLIRQSTWMDLLKFNITLFINKLLHHTTRSHAYTNLSHDEFLNIITDYDHDRLCIKLCQLKIEKVIERINGSIYISVSYQSIVSHVTNSAKCLRTSKGIEEFDFLLQNSSHFINYKSQFHYAPTPIWSELNAFLKEKYHLYKKFEDANKTFYSNRAPDLVNTATASLLASHGLLRLSNIATTVNLTAVVEVIKNDFTH